MKVIFLFVTFIVNAVEDSLFFSHNLQLHFLKLLFMTVKVSFFLPQFFFIYHCNFIDHVSKKMVFLILCNFFLMTRHISPFHLLQLMKVLIRVFIFWNLLKSCCLNHCSINHLKIQKNSLLKTQKLIVDCQNILLSHLSYYF